VGANGSGQLGLGNTSPVYNFNTIPTRQYETIFAGGQSQSTYAILLGKLYSTGANNYGQLGLGNTNATNSFTEVMSPNTGWVKAIGGGNVSFALRNNTIYYAGNFNGTTQESNWVPLDGEWLDFNVGADFCVAISKTDGKLYGIGYNADYQLGLGNNTSRILTFTKITDSTNWRSVACGLNHFMALNNNGAIYGAGTNDKGQLGLNNTSLITTFQALNPGYEDINQIACGQSSSYIIRDNGQLYSTGYNAFSALGLGDNSDRQIFTRVNSPETYDKVVVNNYYGTYLLKGANLYVVGRNIEGNFGLGNTDDVPTILQVPGSYYDIVCGNYHALKR
jgi:alpha-tubulin suppressor-like RCC1 family protein